MAIMSVSASRSCMVRRLAAPLLLLIACGWLTAGDAQKRAQKPPPKPPPREEVEEPARPRPKIPLRVGEDDPDPRPLKQPAGAPAVDLATEAQEAKNPVVRDLFLSLKEPHDYLRILKRGDVNVKPLETYLRPGTKPPLMKSFTKDWKPGEGFLTTPEAILQYEAYEELAIRRVDDFLKNGLEREPASSPRHMSRAEMLQQAEKALAAVLRFHDSARERGVRVQGWDGVKTALQQRLLALQVERLNTLAASGDWAGAFELAVRLKETYARQPELQLEFVKLHIKHVEQVLKGGGNNDYIAARHGLERIEKDVLDPHSRAKADGRLEAIRTALRSRAQQLWARARELEKKDRPQAADLLQTAENIWPALPGLRDARLAFGNAYQILRVGGRHLPEHLSPATAVTDADRQAIELLFESLVKPVYSPQVGQRYDPGLAEARPRLIPLGRQFQLARGARWSNGELVTAADIHGTVQLLKAPNWLGHSPEWADLVEGARVEDPFRVNLGLRRGYLDPLALMTFKVLPANHLKRIDDAAFAAKPIGSGPFQYVGRKQDGSREYALFLANPLYAGRAGKADRPLIREIRFYRCEDPVVEFRHGQIQLLLDLPAEQIKQLESPEARLGHVKVLPLPSRRVYFLAVNHRRPELRSLDLRKAVAFSLDRDKILTDHFRDGHKELHRWLNGPFPRGSWACHPDLDRDDKDNYPFKPQLARALAKKAGLKGSKVTLSYPSDDPRVERTCAYMKTQIEDATEMEIELRPIAPAKLRQSVEALHDYDLAYYHWDYETEAYWLWPLFDPQGVERGGRNFLGYRDDDVLQGRFRQAMSHRDFQAVQAAFREIHKDLFEKMPFIPLWQLDTLIAIHGGLKTVPPAPQLDPQRVFTEADRWRLRE
jgi:peptide/nickel transport system substrate-binding protein